MPFPLDRTDAELSPARQIALNEPVLVRRVIADDAEVTGVNVTVELEATRWTRSRGSWPRPVNWPTR